MTTRRRTALALALLAAAISAVSVYVNATAVKAVGDATVHTTAKNLVAALVLVPIALAAARRDPGRAVPRDARTWWWLLLIGLIGGSLPFVLFFAGLATTGSAGAAFIHKTLVVWVALLAVVVLRERVTWMHAVAVVLLVLGQLGLARVGAFPLDGGALMILAATVLWAVEVIVAKRVLDTVSGWTVGATRMALGGVVLLAWCAASGRFGTLLSLTATQLTWVALTGALLAGYVAAWFAALARAQAVDVTAVLVLGAAGTAVLSGALGTAATPPALGALVAIGCGASLVSLAMLRRPRVAAGPPR